MFAQLISLFLQISMWMDVNLMMMMGQMNRILLGGQWRIGHLGIGNLIVYLRQKQNCIDLAECLGPHGLGKSF